MRLTHIPVHPLPITQWYLRLHRLHVRPHARLEAGRCGGVLRADQEGCKEHEISLISTMVYISPSSMHRNITDMSHSLVIYGQKPEA